MLPALRFAAPVPLHTKSLVPLYLHFFMCSVFAGMLNKLAASPEAMKRFQAEVKEGLQAKQQQVRAAAADFKATTASAARQLVRDLDSFTYEMPSRYKAKFDALETTSTCN